MEPTFTRLLVTTAMLVVCAATPALSEDHFGTSGPPSAGVPLDGPPPFVEAPFAEVDGNCTECELPWRHRTGAFGEFLYLRARDSKVAFAEVVDGPAAPNVVPIQFGQLILVDEDYSPAFRVGGSFALDCDSSVVGSYTHYET